MSEEEEEEEEKPEKKPEKSLLTFVSAGMFILLFIATIALVAPAIASAIACVDLSVASRRDTAWSCAFRPCSLATECRLRTSDWAMTRTASICPSFAAFLISATSFFSWDWRPMRSRSRSRMARSSWRLFSRRSSGEVFFFFFLRQRRSRLSDDDEVEKANACFFFPFLSFSRALTCGRLPLAKDPGHHGDGLSRRARCLRFGFRGERGERGRRGKKARG